MREQFAILHLIVIQQMLINFSLFLFILMFIIFLTSIHFFKNSYSYCRFYIDVNIFRKLFEFKEQTGRKEIIACFIIRILKNQTDIANSL